MGATGYLYNDYFKDITTADIAVVNSAGADKEDANYPIANSQSEQVALCTRSDDKTTIKIRFDINSASGGTAELKLFALLNHNLSGGSIKIYSYTAADYATGQNLEATVAARTYDMYVRIASPSDRRYWEIDLSHNGSATSADSYYEWGRVMCYTDLVSITDIPDYLTTRGYGFRNIVNETAYGVRAAVHKMTEKRERFELFWQERAASNGLDDEIRALYEAVYGDAHPFLFVPDITGTPCYYVYLEGPELLYSELMGIGTHAHVGNITLRLIEAVRGKV